MSNPIVTDKWAGNFNCYSCQRKRLMADEFSKKALDKHRKKGCHLKCKRCMADADNAERVAAAAAAKRGGNEPVLTAARICSTCRVNLQAVDFNRNQLAKGEGKSRCRSCVDKAVADEQSQLKLTREVKIASAITSVHEAKALGNSQAILKAESELAALEAERVTGLKPVKMNCGGRRRPIRGRGMG